MFRRKLLKRVLPVVLSVAMVLETVPATALAAEYDENEAVAETVLEETKENDEDNDAQDENVQDDAQTETTNVSENRDESSETKTQTAEADADDNQAEITAENEENAAAALDTKIVVNENTLATYCNNSGSYKYDVDKKVVLVKYDESNTNPFDSVLTRIKNYCIHVEVDGKTNAALTEKLNYQWKKGDTNLAAGTVPTEAGEYTLVVTIDAADGVCSKAEVAIPFTIAKRQLSVELSDEYTVPGTTVGALKTKLGYILNRETTDWKSEDTEDITEAKASYIETASFTVYDAYQREMALADDVKLLDGKDYVVSVQIALKQAAASNYAIAEETVLYFRSYDRIYTWIEAVQKKPEELISKVYDDAKANEKQISYETDIKDKLTVTVNTYDADDKEIVLDNAAVTEVWFDAAKQELGEGADFEPTTAGTYYLGFRYYPEGDDANIYRVSEDSDYIRVVVERAPLTLVPRFKSEEEVFYTGMREADVLKYADYTLQDAAKAEVKIDRDTFWGVSYDDIIGNTTSTRQSYEPVFQLIRAEKDASGNPVKDENGKEIWTENNGASLASAYCYRLVFTGKKTVYTKAGVEATDDYGNSKRVDVNGSDVDAEDKNHSIVTTEEALLSNYADVTVEDAKKTKMDVSGILQENFNTKDLNDLYSPTKLVSKVYDGKALYEPSRGEYKKAVVTTESGEEAAKDYDSAITYKWYKINSIEAVYDDTDPEKHVQTGWKVSDSTQVGGTSNSIPTAAGEYMLQISFAKTGYVSCTETIYYRIDKQLLVVDMKEIPKAYKGQRVESYTNNVHYLGDYNVYVVPDNAYSEAVKTEENLLKDWYQLPFGESLSSYGVNSYKLNWYVEQLELDENNAPVKDADGNNVYTKLSNNAYLSVTDANTYRLGVTLTTRNSNYTNFEVIYDAEKAPTPTYTTKYYNDVENITVSEAEAGTTPITIALDAEKLTTTKVYDGTPFYATEEDGLRSIEDALIVKNADTEETIAQDKWPYFIYDLVDNETGDDIALNEMVYGGSYTLSLYAIADETYQSAYLWDAAEYTINKRPLTVTPALTEDIPAGTYAGSSNDGVIYNLSKTKIEGYVEADTEAFTYGASVYADADTKTLGFSAYDGALSATVSREGDAGRYYGYIKYGKEYAVKLSGTLAYPHSRNYDVTYVRTVFSATRRGNSTTSTRAFEDAAAVTFARRVDDMSVTVTPTGAIPYMKDVEAGIAYEKEISGEGNYFAFHINAPYEFRENKGYCLEKYSENFIYRSSIEAAGGYVYEYDDDGLDVVFPVKEKTAKSFDIIWENDYTEKYTVDFTNAVLEADLTKAVAPKSLSFNGVNTKMAVGDEQQLDVKIKKAQINDVIYIDYRVTQGNDVISVTTDDGKSIAGYATALKPGKATITAVPVKLVNGVKTKIEGAKEAKVSITVTDVTAPAIKKVTALDKKVVFTYQKPTNGYRREVYILAGKKKAEEFETLIASMKDGQWRGVFAVQPQYYVNERTDAKNITDETSISGLSANGEYTIYVRNVSAIRTLEDGSCVQLSAKGTVKNFKTTKPQVQALRLRAKNDEGVFVTTKNVKLTDKTEQLYTEGQFSTIDIDAAADTVDKSWLTLPLEKDYSKTFTAPKLVYEVTSDLDWVDVSDIRDFRNYTYLEGRYYKKTDIATVDKKGKVTFKGVGKVYVIVYDQTTELYSYVTLNIYANADSVKAKDAKLAVGKGLYLSSLLTYSEGKTAIAGMDYQNVKIEDMDTTYKPNLTISAEDVQKINNEGNFYLSYTGDGDYYIYAKKSNATCSIDLKDGTLSASLKLQSSQIEAVKNLSITNVADERFTIGFSYPVETHVGVVKYRIDITDARGALVDSVMCNANTANTAYNGSISYDGKKKLFTQIVNYQSDKLVRLSKYDVSVTTLCIDEASAKPVKKSVKTTDFPAGYNNIVSPYTGGVTIKVHSKTGGDVSYASTLSERKYLTSGNTYTLEADIRTAALYRMTDTLTWKSSNAKVASVKAKAGTYTAQLNALTPGSTVIEVTSKITKKVIARWVVFVKAVGNAETYYGDYEFTWEYPFVYDPYYTSGMEVLTLQNAVRVTSSELGNNAAYNYKWVKFTAPAYGRYQFNLSGSLREILCSSERAVSTSDIYSPITLNEAETLYFKVYGAFTMEVRDYTKQDASFTAEDGSVAIDSDSTQLVMFRAAEENLYSFYSKEQPLWSMRVYDEYSNERYVNSQTDKDGVEKWSVSLSAGEVIYLEVPAGKYTLSAEKRNAAELTDNAEIKLTEEVKEKWYTYTASKDGLYTFKSTGATSPITLEYYERLGSISPSDWGSNTGNDFTYSITLKAGEMAVFKISADEAAEAKAAITSEIPEELAVGGEKTVDVAADGRSWVSFQLPQFGRYRVSAAATEADAAYDITLNYYKNAIGGNEIGSIEKDEIIVSDNYYDADVSMKDTVYLEITTTKETGAAKVKVSVTEVTAKELTLDTDEPLTVKNGGEYWYTFTPTAPNKTYIIQSVVTGNGADGEETATHTLSGAWYERGLQQRYETDDFDTIGEHDVYYEYPYNTPITFKISADDLGLGADNTEITTAAKIVVKELTAAPLTLNEAETFSLRKSESKWYSFTADEADSYILKRSVVGDGSVSSLGGDAIGSIDYYDIDGEFASIDLEAGKTIYIKEQETGYGAVTVTRTIERAENISGTVIDEVFPLVKGEPKFYKFTAEADNRYMISYTTDDEGSVDITWGNDLISADSNATKQVALYEQQSKYIKLSTDSETPIKVKFHIAPIVPTQLTADGAASTVTVAQEDLDECTWCSFTAETAGRYRISASNPDSYVSVTMAHYNSIMDTFATSDPTSTDSATPWIEYYYNAGETKYFALSHSALDAQNVELTVEKIELTSIENTTDEAVVVEKEMNEGDTAEYLYTAKKTGLYTFLNESSSSYISNKLYMDITDDTGVSITQYKTLFLKENDKIYISISASYAGTAKFSITFKDEVQTISLAGENTIDFGEQSSKLIAFTAAEDGLYNFNIVGITGYAFYMKKSQIIAASGNKFSSSQYAYSGSVAFNKRLIAQGDTVYFWIEKPSSVTSTTVTVTKNEESVTVEKLSVEEPVTHTFEVGDKVWYVFDVPEDGGYELTFNWEDDNSYTSYYVKRYSGVLSELNNPSYSQMVYYGDTFVMETEQQSKEICFEVEKIDGDSAPRTLTITINKR